MGIPFKLYEGKEANLPAELTAGGIYFCEDSGNVFIDVDIDGTVTRVPLGKKYVDDQLVDIRNFIENQGSGIEIGSEPPIKESANVWIDTDDGDDEGVEYLGVVTSINGQGGDVNITASDIDAVGSELLAAAGGVATLDEDGKLLDEQIPGLDKLGAAPAGYGLGTRAIDISEKDITEIAFSGKWGLYRGNNVIGAPMADAWHTYEVFPSYGDGTQGYGVIVATNINNGNKYICTIAGTTIGPWKWFATTDYALNKNSDTVTGQLYFDDWGSGTGKTLVTTHDNRTHIRYEQDENNLIDLMLSMEEEAFLGITRNGEYNNVTILHTGNKPSGSYTGNGDATERTFEVGGIGSLLLLYTASWVGLVGYHGGVFFEYSSASGVAHGLTAADVSFQSGILKITSENAYVNKSGAVFTYQVL